jgi:hypothetical protein
VLPVLVEQERKVHLMLLTMAEQAQEGLLQLVIFLGAVVVAATAFLLILVAVLGVLGGAVLVQMGLHQVLPLLGLLILVVEVVVADLLVQLLAVAQQAVLVLS